MRIRSRLGISGAAELNPSLLISEPEYRNTGVVNDLGDVVLDFALENQDFDAIVSTVLHINRDDRDAGAPRPQTCRAQFKRQAPATRHWFL